MHKLVLLRHGESDWNRENRFTGWTDVDLSQKGVEEARAAGRLLKSGGYAFDLAFTSVLKRAIRTLWLALDELDRTWLPEVKDWRLNERHYGALQGLSKSEMAAKFGEQQVLVWRRSYDTPPPALRRNCRAAHGMPEGHGGARRPLLGNGDRAAGPRRQARAGRRARQLASRLGEAFGQYFRCSDRGREYSDRNPARLRARRQAEAAQALLPRRC